MNTPEIGMTTARGMGPLPQLLEAMSGSRAVDRVFSKVGLPVELTETPDHRIPMTHMVELFEQAAREAGDRFFGLRVGLEMEPGAFGRWTRYGAQAPTLGQAILRLRNTIWVHQNTGSMALAVNSPDAVWTYAPPPVVLARGVQNTDHVLPVMIRFARLFLGAKWTPKRVRCCYVDDGYGDVLSEAVTSQWSFGGKGISIAIDAADLQTRRRFDLAAPLTSVDLAYEVDGIVGSIEAMVATRLLASQTDIDGLARMVGFGVRTLQRRLDAHGTSYRRVLDRVRSQKARALLIETDMPITEIAFLLGYSDPAHFTRSFKRLCGLQPSSVRFTKKECINELVD